MITKINLKLLDVSLALDKLQVDVANEYGQNLSSEDIRKKNIQH